MTADARVLMHAIVPKIWPRAAKFRIARTEKNVEVKKRRERARTGPRCASIA